MYDKHKVWKEIGLFIKRHLIICILCVICILVVLKFSQLPAPDWLLPGVRWAFLCPPEKSTEYEWLSLLNSISLAFITSIIVYIIVDYIPERKKAYKSFSLVKGHFDVLYDQMSKLIYMYMYEVGIQIPEDQVDFAQLSGMRDLKINDQIRKCRINCISNGKKVSNSVGYSLYSDSMECYNKLVKAIGNIKGEFYSSYLDSDIFDILYKIEHNGIFISLSYGSRIYDNDITKVIFMGIDKSFLEFIKIHLSINKYNINKVTYSFSDLSDLEYEKERESVLFCLSRGVYKYLSEAKVERFTNEIISFQPTELRKRKSEGVLFEMLVYYDAALIKQRYILDAALKIAKYNLRNETNHVNAVCAFLNLAQIKKRLHTLSDKDLRLLRKIKQKKTLDKRIIVASAILCEDYQYAKEVFEDFSEEEKDVFIQFPIYHLWKNPPVNANPTPMSFIFQE